MLGFATLTSTYRTVFTPGWNILLAIDDGKHRWSLLVVKS